MGGQRIYLFYGWNRGSQPPLGAPLPRTDMQLDEGFWMRWSDDLGKSFPGGRFVQISAKVFFLGCVTRLWGAGGESPNLGKRL